MKNELRKAKKPFELPHGYIILLCVMLLVAALTWIIPAGEYDIVQNPESGIEEIATIPASILWKEMTLLPSLASLRQSTQVS